MYKIKFFKPDSNFETIVAKNFARNYEKKIILGNIRRLVDESFVPATQRIILKIVGFL